MPRRLLRPASSLLLTLALTAGAAAATLEVGTARVEITPAPGLGMYGFANRKGGATGVRDQLMARVLVLEAGEKRGHRCRGEHAQVRWIVFGRTPE